MDTFSFISKKEDESVVCEDERKLRDSANESCWMLI